MLQYTAIDLFAGCGGASLGLTQAGFDVRVAIELDTIASETYWSNRTGNYALTGDIRDLCSSDILSAAELAVEESTVIVGCPPCQGFSSHRLRGAGAQDPRNQLIITFADLVERVRPKFFVFENVPRAGGMASPWQDARVKLVRAGYRLVEALVEAADYGVPQRRKRFTAVGCRLEGVEISFPSKTHRNPNLRGELPEWITVRQAIGKLPHLSNGEECTTDALHSAPSHNQDSLNRFRAVPKDGGSRSNLPAELVLACHKQHQGHRDVYGRLRWDRPANTITSGCTQPSKGRFLHPEQDRGLTLREAARLQAFPDTYKFIGAKQQVALQIGNAVPPPLAYAFATKIRELSNGAIEEDGLIEARRPAAVTA